MLITNRQVITMIDNIAILKSESIKENKAMPLKISFAISRAFKILESEYKTYLEELQKLNNSYNIIIEGEGKINLAHLSEEQRIEYFDKVEELLEIEIEISVQKIKEEDFGTYEPTFKELDLLGFMLDI